MLYPYNLATAIGDMLGFLDFTVLVFWVHREGVRGPEDAGRQVREGPCEEGDCLVTRGRIGDNGACFGEVAALINRCSEAAEQNQYAISYNETN